MKTKIFLLSIFLVLALMAQATLKVASILGDNMVLQRNTEVKIWGKTDPNQKVTVKADWNQVIVNATSNEKGEWLVKVKTTQAGGPYSISIRSGKEKVSLKNILLGEVWICSGQSNMEMPVAGWSDMPTIGSTDFILDADNPNIRLFTLKKASMETPQDTCVGNWSVASSASVAPFTAVGYLFAKQLQRKLNVPVGIISSNWGGSRVEAWMNKETIAKFPEALKQTTQVETSPNHKASRLYNGMIAPITNFAIKGVLWYQGESNKGNYYDYAALQASMVANWRNDFGVGEFPFFFVQIAPYSYGKSIGIDAALQRDEQLKSMYLIPNSGMISTLDIGEEKNIHPAQKETVAKRLAYWAFAKTYSVDNIVCKSPTFKGMTIKDSAVTITFNDAENGLSTFGKEVECFEIAGQDSIFYPAKMTIAKKQVRVWSPLVKEPVAVRYGFSNFPKTAGYLYNTTGLPVPSFRTDHWLK
ncbi:MAG: sialate O-acetylesterase [Bacteroidia bacterium]|nr:sialate O-acetylesterase [Bacteroidia bacterium]